ncbi:hypothetical protein KI387_022226, partial [Taxus chinensis]
LKLLNLKHNFSARPTFDPRDFLPRENLDPIHIPQIKDIYIDLYHEVKLRRKDHSRLALAEIVQYGVAIVPKGFQVTDQEVDQVYQDTDGDNWPFAEIDRNKAPQTIEERAKGTLQRTEHWFKKNSLIYLGVYFTMSPLGNAPTKPKHLPKGKGKDKEGETSTTQEEAPESPPSTAEEQVVSLVSPEEEEVVSSQTGTSTQDVATTTTGEVSTIPSPAPPSPPHVAQPTTPLVMSSPPSSTVPPPSSSIFSSLMDLSPNISPLISPIPSTPTVSSPAVTPTPVSIGGLASFSMPPPSVSTHFPVSTIVAPSSTPISSSSSGPTPLSPEWISKHLSQLKRKVPIAPMDFSIIPTKGAKKQKAITHFSQSASGERVMEIAYPDPIKEKKDLSPTDFTVTQVTMGTSSEILQGEALSVVDALCKKLQEAKEEKRILKEQNKHLLQALQKMGNAPPIAATETPEALSQEKINEYAKIGEQGVAVSSWREQILKDSEEVITKFTELYQNIDQANKELQAIAGPISEELDHARLQHETFQKMLDFPVNDLMKFGIFDHPRAPNKILVALDYQVDQMEFVLEKIDKIKEEALD